MSVDKRTETEIVLGAILLLVVILTIGTCIGYKDESKSKDSIIKFKNDTIQYGYDKLTKDSVAYTSYEEIQEDDLNQAIGDNKKLSVMVKNFKNIKSVSSISTVSKLQHDTIKLTTTIPCDFAPIYINLDSTDYTIQETVTNKSVVLNTILFPNTQNIVVGTQKNGLFKKDFITASVENSNKYIKTLGITSIQIQPKSHFYNTFLFHALIGGLIATELIHLTK